jgi:[NiFe] hydrogenase assembly HybE family chaperone
MATADPVAGLRAAFVRIAATRMSGLPLNNPRLAVATVGFVPWEDALVGVLVVPWAINLVVVSHDPAALRLAVDTRRRWRFPSGDYELMGGSEPECGCFQFCSLCSPALEFADQAAAWAFALAVRDGLLRPGGLDGRDAARVAGASALHAPLSRRGFLRGAFGAAKA